MSNVVLLFPSDLVDQSNSIVLTLAFLKGFGLLIVYQFLIWNFSSYSKLLFKDIKKLYSTCNYLAILLLASGSRP